MYSKCKLIFLLLLSFFLFPNLVFSAPEIIINTYPTSIVAGQEFNVGFSASGLYPNTNYYSKSIGGVNWEEVDTWNLNWLQQNDAWTSMPTFTSSSEGSASASIKSRFALTTSAGSKEYKIRIRKVDSSTNNDSPAVSIVVSTPEPTSTPTQTATATSTATSTSTPSPTKTSTPVPTKTATAKPTTTATPEETPTEESEARNEINLTGADVKIETSPEGIVAGASVTNKSPLLSIFFIISGVGFLGYGGYLIYNKKHEIA